MPFLQVLYKGWVLRVYTSLDPHSFCPLVCANPNMDVCNITTLPEVTNTTHDAGIYTWHTVFLRTARKYVLHRYDVSAFIINNPVQY